MDIASEAGELFSLGKGRLRSDSVSVSWFAVDTSHLKSPPYHGARKWLPASEPGKALWREPQTVSR